MVCHADYDLTSIDIFLGLWISRIMPCPPSDNSLPYAEDNLPRSLHFSQQGRALVVAYLYHGIM